MNYKSGKPGHTIPIDSNAAYRELMKAEKDRQSIQKCLTYGKMPNNPSR